MRIVVAVTYKEWSEETGTVDKCDTKTFEDSATLAELSQYIGRETRDCMDGTVVVKISPDGGDWPYERYKTFVAPTQSPTA